MYRHLLLRALLLLGLAAGSARPCAQPDQVLVLYNADWTEDLDGTAPGQDSLEVARYYVQQHTDPETGKKPYLLGLSSKGTEASRLNAMRLAEGSQDNFLGLRLKGAPKKSFKRPPHSATHLVAFSKRDLEVADRSSLTIRISPTGKEEDAKLAFSDGEPVEGYPIREKSLGKDRTAYGFTDRSRFPDGFTAWVTCQRSKGKGKPLRDYHARFYFPEQFEADLTGPDGVRDDANYLADMAEPIRAFLTAPENRLPDGTPLKDHILYLLVCYGLPKQVEATYGVARGVRAQASHRDDGSSAEQRLALLFHNTRRYHQVKVVPNPRKANHPPAIIGSRLRLSLVGANPYRHPVTHMDRKGPKQDEPVSHPLYKSYAYDAQRIPHFTQKVRRALGDRFLYGVTRIDGRHPEIAKAQVDGALYGSRYLTPFLGWFWAGKWAKAKLGAEELRYLEFPGKPPEEPMPHERGRCLFYFGDFGYGTEAVVDPSAPGRPYRRGFYPGSVGYAVRSYLGWEMRRNLSQLYTHNSRYPERILDAGATVCMLSGHGAHDTSVTWWDDQVAFHHLLRGYQLGEVFLMSSLYLDWVRTDVGDPLYRPDLHSTSPDETAPRVASAEDLRIHLGAADGRYWARLRPTMEVTRENPEMAEMAVTFWRTPEEKRTVSNWRFSRRPKVLISDLAPASVYHYQVTLTDPYGNRFSSAETFGDLTFATGPVPDAKRLIAKLEYEPPKDGEPSRVEVPALETVSKRPYLAERGEMHIHFTPTKRGWRLFEDRTRQFLCDHRGFRVGGRMVAFVPPLNAKGKPMRPFPWEQGRRYHLVLRWRRDPLVRQAALVAANGEEFILGSNNRLCWLPVDTAPTLFATNHRCVLHKLIIYDDTRPGPRDPLYPARFDRQGFLNADGRVPQDDAETPSKAPETAEPEKK